MKKLVCFLLCLFLPAAGLAVTEGVVEEAAQVDVGMFEENESSYLPDPSYYASDAGYEPEWGASETYVEPEFDGECFGPSAQWPGLTSGEIVRAKKLLAMYENGEATGDGARVLNAQKDVVLGVYSLNPQEYDGEKVFVILPNTSISDENMLAMIDAFAQLGLRFDPEGLTARNCMRGGGLECTRFYTEEEQARRTTLHILIRRGKLTGVKPMEDLSVELDPRYFNGLDGFSFRPYRSMTDEELAGQLVAMGVHDESDELDFDGVEKATREILTRILSCPMSMKLETITKDSAYVPRTFTEDGKTLYAKTCREALYASYEYPKEGYEKVIVFVQMDAETGLPVEIYMTDIPIGWLQVETERDPSVPDEAYFAAAQAYVTEHMNQYIAADALNWQMDTQDVWWINYGPSVRVFARIPETKEMISVHVGCGDMQVHMVDMNADQRDWGEGFGPFEDADDMPING